MPMEVVILEFTFFVKILAMGPKIRKASEARFSE
jgi:hypothetical protein